MPHRSPWKVIRGEGKKHVRLESSGSDQPFDNEANASMTSIASSGQQGTVAGDLDLVQYNSHDEADLINDDSVIDPPEGSDPNESSVDSRLRLLVSDSSELGLWRQAWDEVSSELHKMLPLEFQSIETLDTLVQVREVHKEAQKRAHDAHTHERKIPGTNRTFRDLYGKVASCANKFQIVGDMVTQAEPVYAALPWALIRFVIQCAVGEDEAYRTMLGATELVADLVSQYPALEKLYGGIDSDLSKKLRKSLVNFYKTILQSQVYAINYFDPNSKARRATLGLNPVTAEDIRHRRQEIDSLKVQVDGDAALVSYEVSKTGIDNLKVGQEGQKKQLEAIKEGIIALGGDTGHAIRTLSEDQEARNKMLIAMWKEPLHDLRMEVENCEIEKARQNLHNVRRWLSVTMPWDDLRAAKEKRDMPLGDWLVNHQRFRQWKTLEESSILWLYGFAGTGKTGLSCRVIGELELSSQKSGRTAFFFCSRDSANPGSNQFFSRSDPEEALRSIVSQLATSQGSNYVAPILQDKFKTCGPDSDQSMNLAYADCIEVIVAVSEFTPVTIVLDSFDECDQNRSSRLIQNLEEVIRQSPKNVKILISTRAFPAIEDKLTPDRSIEVTAENNGCDVRMFIRSTLDKRIQDKILLSGNVPEDLRDEIEVTLTSRANNMFLYASLMLEQLCDKSIDDPEIIRKRLESLPRDLQDIYKRIMAEIHDENTNTDRSRLIAQNTFKWLLCAQEPLESDALQEAIWPPDRKAKHEDVIRACRTLVIRPGQNYEFVHYSIREYVGQMEEYSCSQCHLVATQSCLNVLDRSIGTDKRYGGLSEAEKAFEQYAILYWPLHYEGIKKDHMRHQRTAINGLLRSILLQGRSQRDKYYEWLQEVQKKDKQLKNNKYLTSKINAIQASPSSPLFAACVFGLEDLIAKFGREPNALNKVNESGQTALCLAIEHNKLDVVKALLTRRFPADPNLLNVKAVAQWDSWDDEATVEILYASAMQCAAATGRHEIAEYLIEHGAHIDLVAGYLGSPLQAAAYKGNARFVHFLLSKGAEPNSQGGYHGNALQAAAAAGHSTIINLLLENKPPALVDTPGGHYGSALRAAVHSGSSDTVWALLEEKSNPNMNIKGHGSLLDEAVSMGSTYKDIVRDLINAGAEVELSPKGKGVHILHRAAMFGMMELVEHCLDHDCQIDAVTTQGPAYDRFGGFPTEMTPLAYACAEGHARIVDLLLHRNASLELGKPNAMVLWIAAHQGHAHVVDLLLRRFRESHGLGETAKFLEERPVLKGRHPILWAAASSGKADVVKILVEQGAKYESNTFDATPLYAAATYGCPHVTEVFLDYHRRQVVDICINQKNNRGRTAFHQACARRRPRIAKILLDAGADYLTTDGDNTTPLQVSCFHGIFRIISAIIEKASHELEQMRFLKFLNTRHSGGRTALIDCVERGRLAAANILLRHGADYRISDDAGNTPLHWGCIGGHEEIVRTILKQAKSDDSKSCPFSKYINRGNAAGYTPFMETAGRNHLAVAKVLLNFGADYVTPRIRKEPPSATALHDACWNGSREVVTHLLEVAFQDLDKERFSQFINARDGLGKTPLHNAAQMGRPRIVELLLSNYQADYSTWNKQHFTPLHAASMNGRIEVVTVLLGCASQDKDQNRFTSFVDHKNIWGNTVLWDACKEDRPKVVRMLLERGADYTIAGERNITPLHMACRQGCLNAATTLLDFASKNPDQAHFNSTFLNCKGKRNKTPLMDACMTGHGQIARLLLEHGADYTLGDTVDFTALHYAAYQNRVDCARVLLEHAARDCGKGPFETFLNQQGGDKLRSALHDVARLGYNKVAKIILEYTPAYDTLDTEQKTPLHYAVEGGNKELARDLVVYAAMDSDKERLKRSLNMPYSDGDTIWHNATRMKMKVVVDAMKATGVVEMEV